ncbi:MAG: prephenate dehydratase [Clostridiales bacterium]|nr:prephenate dehydratase [Clostridiales bacterium]
MKYGYLGPQGTFSHSAADFFAGEEETVPYSSIYNVLLAVDGGEIDCGVVPVENSTEGSINTTIDTLIFDFDLKMTAQLNMPIAESLVVKEGTRFEDITRVLSHPQPLAQCSHYLRENLPYAETFSVSSTTEAMKQVSESEEPIAAIGNKISAPLYGLRVLRENIQDDSRNFTQFALVSKREAVKPEKTTKTTVAFSVLNEPGNLFKILSIFSIYDVNMVKIISRPMRNRPEEYVFFVELENNNPKDIEESLMMVKRKTSFFKILGTYNLYDLRN